MSRKEFEDLVQETLDSLPGEFLHAIENVSVIVEDEPSAEDIEAAGLVPGNDTLFGLYQGVPLPERDTAYSTVPDRILIYRRPILEVCDQREQVVGEVRTTVLHELGHYFGLGEEEVPE